MPDGQRGLATHSDVGIVQQGDERVGKLGVLAPAEARHRGGPDPGIGILEEGQQERTRLGGGEFAQRARRARSHERLVIHEERLQEAQGPRVTLQPESQGYSGPGLPERNPMSRSVRASRSFRFMAANARAMSSR